jgi:hypothetical protein
LIVIPAQAEIQGKRRAVFLDPRFGGNELREYYFPLDFEASSILD